MTGEITDSERRRFVFYTRFIRTIILWSSDEVDSSVFQSLVEVGLGTHLLPQLHSIYCTREWAGMPEALRMLSRPALRHLTLNAGREHPQQQTQVEWLLSFVCVLAPNIESLALGGNGQVPSLQGLKQMRHLRTLEFVVTQASPQNHRALVLALAPLKQLEELTLRDVSSSHSADLGSLTPAPYAGLAHLRKMTVIGGLQIFSALYARLRDLRLQELCLDDLPPEQLPHLEDLVHHCSPGLRTSLSVLRIKCRTSTRVRIIDDQPSPPSTPAPLVLPIRPLLELPNIRTFSFEAQNTFIIDDEDLHAIGHAWPQLASLDLRCTATDENPPVAPTIHGVASLVKLCRGLRSVKLPSIVTLGADRVVEAPYALTKNRRLPEDEELPDDAIKDVEVGRLVDILWPLFGVAYSPRVDTFSERWSAVLREIARVQNERERSRAK